MERPSSDRSTPWRVVLIALVVGFVGAVTTAFLQTDATSTTPTESLARTERVGDSDTKTQSVHRVSVDTRDSEMSGEVRGIAGSPFAGAPVFAFAADPRIEDRAKPLAATETDAHGEFSFSGIPLRPVFVTAQVHGFAAPVVESGSNRERIVIQLEEPYVLTDLLGFVVDQTGRGVPSFEIRVRSNTPPHEPLWRDTIQKSVDGAFHCSLRLPPDTEQTVQVAVMAAGYRSPSFANVTLTAGSPPPEQPLRIVLQQALERSGIVLAPGGGPVAGARISPFRGAHGEQAPSVRSLADGRFVFEHGQAHELRLVLVEAEGYAPKWVRGLSSTTPEATRDEIVVKLDHGATVSGFVMDAADAPVARQAVALWTDSADERQSGWFPAWQRVVLTDEQGYYEFANAPTERMWLATLRRKSGHQDTYERTVVVAPTAGSRTEVDFVRGNAGIAVHGTIDIVPMPEDTCLWVEVRKQERAGNTRAIARWDGCNRAAFAFEDVELVRGDRFQLRIGLSPVDFVDREFVVDAADAQLGVLRFDLNALDEFNRSGTLISRN